LRKNSWRREGRWVKRGEKSAFGEDKTKELHRTAGATKSSHTTWEKEERGARTESSNILVKIKGEKALLGKEAGNK